MKEDMDKILSRTLFTYFMVLLAIFILKLFGLNYFGIDFNNKTINTINNFILYWRLQEVWQSITLFINTFIILAITCNDNSKRLINFTILTMPLNIFIRFLKRTYDIPFLFVFTDLLYLFILSLCYIKIVKKDKCHRYNVGNYFIFTLTTIIFQFISLITRGMIIQSQSLQENNFIVNLIINFDYLVLLIISYKLYFIKGGKSIWIMVHGFSSDLLISLKTLPTRFQTSYQRSRPKETDDELANKIYLILFWLYNFFTVATVLFIATLNDTFIECIFILSSFWINKGVFGKPFHLKKASTCFIVSSLSYYILNRLTFKVGISFLVPVALGIALSYITSMFMARKENLCLYRGMPIDKFYSLITRVTSNEEHVEICKMYYIDKETNVKIAIKFNYSEINIKKIKKKINDDIKELPF